MKSNHGLVAEVCSLNELGYPLTVNQNDLTFIQKLFLFLAYPIFKDLQKNNKPTSRGSVNQEPSTDISWEDRTRKRIEEKRRKLNNGGS